ncbi:hypothetical protein AB4347_02010 [Vibrio breoganii]|uniref:hypothetical protein n=1 Tax=Vibrio TaxID=662 RepID=UPI000C839299|nr:hypothetical protein [Vibrio breoganii]PMG94203.1 hypothetical protein BCU80_07145 [Vibrio breoganii]PMK23240.1 hypothetical protein BCU06_04315 [Vibrio breoganii]PMK55648.1 hypothetical protein BCT98_10255 [Vibrio breoganii]PMK67127.1 hypothetical protein BCT94_17585 [Vibrio breoganii]PML25784.1 hypothetical protein BCT82_11215 [Vibrio breoganii]
MNITQFESPRARESHEELKLALGTENNPAQWMMFMETVERLLPELSEQGRLPKEVLTRTFIGQLGFESWKEYVESSEGLNWKIGGWNAYRRAWSSVKVAPYLREMEIKAGWVNSLARSLAKDGLDFPETKADLDALLEQQERLRSEAKENTQSALKERVIQLSAQVEELKVLLGAKENETNALEKQLILKDGDIAAMQLQLRGQTETSALQVEKMQIELDAERAQFKVLKNENEQLKNELNQPVKISRIEALKLALFGS